MKRSKVTLVAWLLTTMALMSLSVGSANATEPCGDFGECKVLVEINSTDGDIGFHFLMDGDNLIRAALFNPYWRKLFIYTTRRELRDQFLTETFSESAEPLCWEDPEADDDEEIVTLEDFLERWKAGIYHFVGIGEGWELAFGASELTFALPAAPKNLMWTEEEDDGDIEGEISWEPGDDLGNCASYAELAALVADGELPVHPADVPVAVWEIVFEPETDLGEKFVNRIAAVDDDGEPV
ncbi:MAG: hypothetical protein KJO82_03085, partial [Gammaproteobacteria bacterium]|nr:hypothetical protein [Gammaproteobacteria bacterium]